MNDNVKFTVEIDSGNDAIVDWPENAIYLLLHEVAEKVRAGRRCGPLFDANGNRIGQFGFTD